MSGATVLCSWERCQGADLSGITWEHWCAFYGDLGGWEGAEEKENGCSFGIGPSSSAWWSCWGWRGKLLGQWFLFEGVRMSRWPGEFASWVRLGTRGADGSFRSAATSEAEECTSAYRRVQLLSGTVRSSSGGAAHELTFRVAQLEVLAFFFSLWNLYASTIYYRDLDPQPNSDSSKEASPSHHLPPQEISLLPRLQPAAHSIRTRYVGRPGAGKEVSQESTIAIPAFVGHQGDEIDEEDAAGAVERVGDGDGETVDVEAWEGAQEGKQGGFEELARELVEARAEVSGNECIVGFGSTPATKRELGASLSLRLAMRSSETRCRKATKAPVCKTTAHRTLLSLHPPRRTPRKVPH